MNAWSIGAFTSAAGFTLSTDEGHATCGVKPETSNSTVLAYTASASLCSASNGGNGCVTLVSRNLRVAASGAMMPFLAPISTAMLHSVILPAMLMLRIVWPVNSALLYIAPSTPNLPIMAKIRSLGVTDFANCPSMFSFMASGTFSQILPVANTAAASVEPMPVAKAPNAPYVQVCESAPTITVPGVTWPFSGMTWWQMPPWPTSYMRMFCSLANVRIVLWSSAALMDSAGIWWSRIMIIFLLFQTFLTPMRLNASTANGPVRSWIMTVSTLASTISSGCTCFLPDAWARIFSVMFMFGSFPFFCCFFVVNKWGVGFLGVYSSILIDFMPRDSAVRPVRASSTMP